MAAALFIAAALSALLPQVLPALFGGTFSAWEYVCYGIEAAALWCVVGLSTGLVAARVVAAWGFFEAMQRPVCRLQFPMDHPVKLERGETLCDAAFGFPMSLVSLFAALAVAVVFREVKSES